jgi:DNA-binding CsgD family transcriptional regulator
MRAARVLFAGLHGEIPPGMVVRHTCDNHECLNPEHLLLGTHKDNMQDAKERGRVRQSRYLSEAEIQQINDLREAGKTIEEIGAIFKMGRNRVYQYLKPYNKRIYA